MNEPTITLMRGLQGSGKTKWAKAYVESWGNAVRVNRDDIRMQLYGKYTGVDEDIITEVETAMVRAALRSGQHVVIDAMHLQQRYINKWQRLGYKVVIDEHHASLHVLLERNAHREKQVPESVIRKNFEKYTNKDGSLKKVSLKPEEFIIGYKYTPDDTLTTAVIVDLDGTLAHNDGHRSFFDYSKVRGDKPHWHVIDAVNGLSQIHHIIVVSGRKAEAREDSKQWLLDHGVSFDELITREDDDSRTDVIVKMEILRDQIAPRYNVIATIDDRPSVCEMWRNVGIPTFQMGDPEERF